ncbi:MAG: ribosome recycling factor [Myxococcaceae bacterium]|jgi:ribosome recycling factor|nr:ribosome recycling factor [Myxococcaceae bacterium]MCA3013858.1 ribosome recycling factor [Myxococcaceae bacterium]
MAAHDDVVKGLTEQIKKTIDALKGQMTKIRTGRANAAMLDAVRVNFYGTPTPLAQCAAIAVPEARLITVKPWDKSILKDIEKAIHEANLGLTPQNDGEIIRLPIPPLTEQRRKEIAKDVKAKGEEHKVAVRNERRDANEKLKALLKDKKITEDDNKRAQEKVQKETDAGITQIDDVVAKKEKEVLEV